MFRDLRDYLSALRSAGELVEVDTLVDPVLEVAEIHRRVIAEGGPALLFTNVKGALFPLVTNLFGTKKRVELAFGKRPQQFLERIAKLPETFLPPTLTKAWQHRDVFFPALKVGTKMIRSAPVMAVEEAPKLNSLPLLTTWEEDGGAFITLPLVYTAHPQTKIPNLGMYRLQRFDDHTTGFHCQIGKGGGFHLAEAERLGQPLPVNVFLGGPPSLILGAIAPLPENVPELLLSSLLQGEKFPLVSNSLNDLPIAAYAEFAFAGRVMPNERRAEGPFGDHYGYYSLKHEYPLFHIDKMFRRRDAICTATVVGKPRQEDFFIGDYLQELLSPLFPVVMPSVKSLWSYGETGYHSLAAAVVKQRYKREAMMSAFRILGEGQLSLTKFLLVTDREIDLRNFKEVLPHILERADFRTDLYIFSNLSMDTLDYTGPKVNEGSKGVLLGVGEPIRSLPQEVTGELPNPIKFAAVFCPGCLVVELSDSDASKNFEEFLAPLSTSRTLANWPLIVVVNNANAATKSVTEFLWMTFTRFEPGRDIHGSQKLVEHNHLSFTPPLFIDARLKPGFPKELLCDAKTKALVDSNWSSYFPS